MKSLVKSSLLAIVAVCEQMALADEASGTSTHHVIKDSAITTRARAKLAVKHLSTLTRVKVGTDENGVVWLSGAPKTRME